MAGGLSFSLVDHQIETKNSNERELRLQKEIYEKDREWRIAEFRCASFKEMYELERKCDHLQKIIDELEKENE